MKTYIIFFQDNFLAQLLLYPLYTKTYISRLLYKKQDSAAKDNKYVQKNRNYWQIWQNKTVIIWIWFRHMSDYLLNFSYWKLKKYCKDKNASLYKCVTFMASLE